MVEFVFCHILSENVREAEVARQSYLGIFIIAVIGATPLPKYFVECSKRTKAGNAFVEVVEPVVMAALLLVVTAYLVDGSFNPFLYFRF